MSQTFTVNINGTLTQITVDVATETTLDGINTKVGEVQANPTQYTLLERLKAIYTALTGTLTVSGTVTADTGLIQPLTDTELRASALDVNVVGGSGGGLTDTQLRASPVPVSGTFWQATQPVSFTWSGLTDTELRASPVPVSGTFWQATQPVSFTWSGLTDTQLRASAVPVSLASVPSHNVTNAGTFAVQVTSAPTTAVTGTFWQATQPVSLSSLPAFAATPTFKNQVVATETSSSVASSATVVTLLASNANRTKYSVYNDSTQVLYIKHGSAASTTDYKLQIPAGGYFECDKPTYTGIVTGIWASANGSARLSEG